MDGDAWPVALQDLAAVRVDFTEGDGAEASGSLKPEAESTDAGKEVEDI